MSHCTFENCKGIILADTEYWDEPLCYEHWHKNRIETLYEEVWSLIDNISCLKLKALEIGEAMKELR